MSDSIELLVSILFIACMFLFIFIAGYFYQFMKKGMRFFDYALQYMKTEKAFSDNEKKNG